MEGTVCRVWTVPENFDDSAKILMAVMRSALCCYGESVHYSLKM